MSSDRTNLRVTWLHTSGTTGEGLRFAESLESFQREYAFRFQSYSWAGARLGGRWALCAGHPVVPPDCTAPPFWVYDRANNWLIMSSYHLTSANLPHYIDELKDFKPEMLYGYPSSIFLLALMNKRMGRLVRPCTVVTSSETLLDHQRREIEDSFQCKAFSYYGNSERAGCMSQCENGLFHVRAEHSYVEILDEQNQPVKPGGKGRLVVTAFGNYATPLIRYDIGDVAVLSEKATCSCGRGGILVERIIGRVEDYIVTPDGKYVGRLDHLFKNTTNVLMGQIVQDRVDEVRILIVRDGCYTEKDEAIIQKEARTRLGNEINIRFEYVDDIPRTREGKFRFVISHIEKKGLFEQTEFFEETF
jgi:phenylacetate-CoA ligase